ncbi:putative protein phosphatase 2C 73 [Nymphaea thermarum]|nr:putative protein phosphatase 2C 73 [Nymphaea thermarum]
MTCLPFSCSTRAYSVGTRKGKTDDGRDAADELAKEAKRNHQLVKSNRDILAIGSNGIASFFSQRGKKGINQDCFVVWEGFGFQEDMMFCGMFDGHGPWGHYVSKRVRDSLPSALLCQWQKDLALAAVDSGMDYECSQSNITFDVWKQCYLRTCALVDRELDQHQGFYSFSSGTTSLAVIKQGDMVVLANVGDSRAVLGRTSEDGSIMAVQMTVDCKPNEPQEAERIRQSRGEVFCLPDEPGIYRIWSPTHEAPGLSTSRAFGDYCLKEYGITSAPEVTQWRITERDKFIVLATDGVWDVLSNQEAVEIVSSAEQKETSAKILAESAVNAWKRRRPGLCADDCSAICLFFQSSSPRRQNNLVDGGTKNKRIVSPSGLVAFGR